MPDRRRPDRSITEPLLYRALATVSEEECATDTYGTIFGFRWIERTAGREFFFNGKHVWLFGAKAHRDHAGWGDAVINAAHERGVGMVKQAGFISLEGGGCHAAEIILVAAGRGPFPQSRLLGPPRLCF